MYSVRGRPPPGSHVVARHPLVRRGHPVTGPRVRQGGARLRGHDKAGIKKAPCESRARRPSTIGDRRLNFRVRNGNGCDPPSITAETYTAGRVRKDQKDKPNQKAAE